MFVRIVLALNADVNCIRLAFHGHLEPVRLDETSLRRPSKASLVTSFLGEKACFVPSLQKGSQKERSNIHLLNVV